MKVFKWALFGAAGVAVAGFLAVTALGSAVTQAEEGEGGHARAFTRHLADVLGIAPSQLQEDRKEALNNMLDEAVENGTITQEQADKIREHPLRSARMLKGAVVSVFDAAADTLGMTKEELRDEVAGGKSLADVAAEQNVSVDQLKAGITSEITGHLDQAVADGRITEEQKDKILDGLTERLDTIVNHEGGSFMDREGGRFRRP